VEFDKAARSLTVRVDFAVGSRFAVSGVDGAHPVYRQILTTLGRLLPSFGLIGTLIGMVLMLSRVAALEPKGLPSALGLALLTTLYGALFANVLVAPLLARLQAAAAEKESSMRMTKDWLLMLARCESAPVVEARRAGRRSTEAERLQEWAPSGAMLRR
jgi:chemotaxis protein MotA